MIVPTYNQQLHIQIVQPSSTTTTTTTTTTIVLQTTVLVLLLAYTYLALSDNVGGVIADGLSDTEIDQLQTATNKDEVGWLEISMDDSLLEIIVYRMVSVVVVVAVTVTHS